MNREFYLDVEHLAESTINQIGEKQYQLRAELSDIAAESLRKSLLQHFESSSKELQYHIEQIPLPRRSDLPKGGLREYLLDEIKQGKCSDEVLKEAEELLQTLNAPESIDDVLQPETPIGLNPLFRDHMMRGRMHRLAMMDDLSEAKTEALLDAGGTLATLDHERLVDSDLDEEEATKFGFTLDLYRFLREDVDLAKHIKTNKLEVGDQNESKQPRTLRDLVELRLEDWTRLLEQADATPPDGLEREQYALVLNKTLETLFPTETLANRINHIDFEQLTEDLEYALPARVDLPSSASSLSTRSSQTNLPTEEDSHADEADDSSFEAQDRKKRGEAVRRIANRFPGLGLNEIFEDTRTSAPERVHAAQRRIGMFDRFRTDNVGVNLLGVDYSLDSEQLGQLDFASASDDDDRDAIVTTLKAHQRTYRIIRDVDHTADLVSLGYHSATNITAGGQYRFLKTVKNDVDESIARAYYQKALDIAGELSVKTMSIRDAMFAEGISSGVEPAPQPPGAQASGLVKAKPLIDVSPGVRDYFKRMRGFAELFGNQDYCRCEHCSSILSPAAYFADLMFFLETNVLEPTFDSDVGDKYHLKKRRPDLWTLNLTCENTETEIPLLQIITEVLEKFIGNENGFVPSDDQSLEQHVYGTTLSKRVHTFEQPFYLPLERLHIYLDSFGLSRGDIVELMEPSDPSQLVAAKFGLSELAYNTIISPNTDVAFLRELYDLSGQPNDPLPAQPPTQPEVKDLLRPMSLTRSEFSDLVETAFVNPNRSVRVESKKRHEENSVQNDMEVVVGLNADVLDRMHRFVRFWRRTEWTIRELDVFLSQLAAAGIDDIKADTLDAALDVRWLQRKFRSSLEQLLIVIHEIPQTPIDPEGESIFDRMFNLPEFVASNGRYPSEDESFIVPGAPGSDPNDIDPSLHRLLSGLAVTSEELMQLIANLQEPLGLSPVDFIFPLSSENLTVLARHALLADLLDISVEELFQIIRLNSKLANEHVTSLSDTVELVRFHEELTKTKFTTDQIYTVTVSGAEQSPTDDDVADFIENLRKHVEAEQPFHFADTVFAFVGGVSETDSKELVRANVEAVPAQIEAVSETDFFALSSAFDETIALELPPDFGHGLNPIELAELEEQLRQFISAFHSKEIVPTLFARELGISVEKTKALFGLAEVDLSDTAFRDALQDSSLVGPLDLLATLVRTMLTWSVLFQEQEWDETAIAFLKGNLDLFGSPDFPNSDVVGLDTLRLMSEYRYWLGALGENDGRQPLNPTLLNLVEHLQNNDPFPAEGIAELLAVEPELIRSFERQVSPLPSNAIEAFRRIADVARVAQKIGVDGEALSLIASNSSGDDGYTSLTKAADAVLSALRARTRDEEAWKTENDGYNDKLLNLKRDALVDFLTSSIDLRFRDEKQLYDYFLLDIKVDACFKSSRVIAAISSLQLYVQRILLNLEQDRDADEYYLRPDLIPEEEWEWRKLYRVWQANREVFLWPEHFMLPELRDNKTPPFEDLETGILQNEINDQNVTDAYARYLNEFETVAGLKIVGTYHDIKKTKLDSRTEQEDRLHVFGMTADDPPITYRRVVENIDARSNRATVWHPWRKVDVSIPIRNASPVVHNSELLVFWVNIASLKQSKFADGNSIYGGVLHKFTISYSKFRSDQSWTAPQQLKYQGGPFQWLDWTSEEIVSRADYNLFLDDDPPNISPFDKVFVGSRPGWLILHTAAFQVYAGVDLFENRLFEASLVETNPASGLRPASPIDQFMPKLGSHHWDNVWGDPLGFPSVEVKTGAAFFDNISDERYLFEDDDGTVRFVAPVYGRGFEEFGWATYFGSAQLRSLYVVQTVEPTYVGLFDLGQFQVDDRACRLMPLNGNSPSAIIYYSRLSTRTTGEQYFLKPIVNDQSTRAFYAISRFGTTIATKLRKKLFVGGVDGLLGLEFQDALREVAPKFDLTDYVRNDVSVRIDYRGAYGTYFREIWFHAPFLIACQLNTNGEFGDAKKWLEYIFNPTNPVSGNPLGPSDRVVLGSDSDINEDSVWRFAEFQKVTLPSLRQTLTDHEAIERMKEDPFNPWTIARVRLSAFQKCVVLKYVDNLIDHGDHEFSKFTMESVNEATNLYATAEAILGERPVEVGDCAEPETKTYEDIREAMENGSEFLQEIETELPPNAIFIDATLVEPVAPVLPLVVDPAFIADAGRAAAALPSLRAAGIVMHSAHDSAATDADGDGRPDAAFDGDSAVVSIPGFVPTTRFGVLEDGPGQPGPAEFDRFKTIHRSIKNRRAYSRMTGSMTRQLVPAFCIPADRRLHEYWERLWDRFFKIRNCMDITGARRSLALVAPYIDPAALVRAKAAGLSVDDVLNSLNGSLPPYRFDVLIRHAKAAAATVQGFGAALLNVQEKKDVEELTLLRSTQNQDAIVLTRQTRDLEYQISKETLAALKKRRKTVEKRQEYYSKLIETPVSVLEGLQLAMGMMGDVMRTVQAVNGALSATVHLTPEAGAPTAMKYGGKQLGDSIAGFSGQFGVLAAIADNQSRLLGIGANYDRRTKEWEQQETIALAELDEIDKQIAAAEIRRDVAEHAIRIQKQSEGHLDELHAFYKDKFTNMELFSWLVQQTQPLHREAYNNAYAIAKLAEQAYRFERDDDTTPLLSGNYWDSSKAGLLAGARLSVELQAMEQRFLESNHRDMEIDQSFSLSQIDPAALVRLKQDGECDFTIPKLYFDLFYPGQFFRKIRSARLTIPCIAGAYTNVSATLTLNSSEIRRKPSEDPIPVPASRSTTIATSTAQNDAGVFELSFRDERYMPFEGAGAINSEWRIQLPKNFRQFSYDSINDVILHISYTAKYDGLLRETVESDLALMQGEIAATTFQRAYSLRQEFSADFTRLANGQDGSRVEVPVTLSEKHFPFFLQGRNKNIESALLISVTNDGQLPSVTVDVAGVDVTDGPNNPADEFASLPRAAFQLDVGEPFVIGASSPINTNEIRDILILVRYTVEAP